MNGQPSPNGDNGGRDLRGRFTAGNPGGPGNPHARKAGQLRAALLRAVTVRDIREIAAALVKRAKGGDVVAAREILDRCIGRPAPSDEGAGDYGPLVMYRGGVRPLTPKGRVGAIGTDADEGNGDACTN